MQTRTAELESLPRTALERFRDARGEGGILFDRTRLRQADWSTFDPGKYAGAEPVDGAGGRGSAWFVEAESGPAVIKRYLRGGWMASLSDDAYLWLGEDAVRSRREFELLMRMQAAGLPVPAPLAAGWRRSGLVYHASLMTQRIANVESLVESVRRRGVEAPWRNVGEALARFHEGGLHHADLNAHNVLLARDDSVHVIDWDKGVVEAGPASWCEAVLARLERSLRKRLPELDPAVLDTGMARLRQAHDAGLSA